MWGGYNLTTYILALFFSFCKTSVLPKRLHSTTSTTKGLIQQLLRVYIWRGTSNNFLWWIETQKKSSCLPLYWLFNRDLCINDFAHIPWEDTPNFPKPPKRKNSFINCWWNIRGTFHGYVGEILDCTGLLYSLCKWVVVHPLYILNNQSYFHCSIFWITNMDAWKKRILPKWYHTVFWNSTQSNGIIISTETNMKQS